MGKLPRHKSISYYSAVMLVPAPGDLPTNLSAVSYDIIRRAIQNGEDYEMPGLVMPLPLVSEPVLAPIACDDSPVF